MKVNINTINPVLVLEIKGQEPWLKQIYSDYYAKEETPPILTGKLTMRVEEAGTIHVEGDISFTPQLACGRCVKMIPWPLNIELDMRFFPAKTQSHEKEKNLSRADLDAYYIEKSHIDLELLLNDAINQQIPGNPTKTGADGSCTTCGKDMSDVKIWSSEEDKSSPFASLKGVKLPN